MSRPILLLRDIKWVTLDAGAIAIKVLCYEVDLLRHWFPQAKMVMLKIKSILWHMKKARPQLLWNRNLAASGDDYQQTFIKTIKTNEKKSETASYSEKK